jgi:hypothetical protein
MDFRWLCSEGQLDAANPLNLGSRPGVASDKLIFPSQGD